MKVIIEGKELEASKITIVSKIPSNGILKLLDIKIGQVKFLMSSLPNVSPHGANYYSDNNYYHVAQNFTDDNFH